MLSKPSPVPDRRTGYFHSGPRDLDQAAAARRDLPMQVIVFASQKGGAGKTTLCGQLAVQADLVGAGPVALIDTDPQGSLADWWNVRAAETPTFVKTDLDHLNDDLERLRQAGVKLVFIDTPPAVTETILEMVSRADLVVVPTRPSPHDLRAVGATVDIIEGLDKPMVFAVNAATVRARITGDAAVALSQHGTVAPVTVHQRVDFATSMIDGQTVMERKPDSRSAKEIADLWQYLTSRLGRIERRRGQRPRTGPDRRGSGHGHGTSGPVRTSVFGRRISR
jgi:chromosome partitioning protein